MSRHNRERRRRSRDPGGTAGLMVQPDDFQRRLGPAVNDGTHWVLVATDADTHLAIVRLLVWLLEDGLPESAALYGTVAFWNLATGVRGPVSVLALAKKDVSREVLSRGLARVGSRTTLTDDSRDLIALSADERSVELVQQFLEAVRTGDRVGEG